MITCKICGTNNQDGSVYCKGCGKRLDVPAQPVFCPECGKKFTEGEEFCDNCGTKLDSPAAGAGAAYTAAKAGRKKIPGGKAIAIAAAGIVVVAAGAFGVMKLAGGTSGGVSRHLVYYTDEAIMLADLKQQKKEPVQVTDSYYITGYEPFTGISSLSHVTKDGSYLYYLEDYDGSNYELHRVPVKKAGKKEASVKIDSRVDSYKLLDNNNVLYLKNDSLYYFDGKESKRFGRDVQPDYRADEASKYACWAELDDDGTKTYYYQDLAQKKDAVELGHGITRFYANAELTKFYALKEDKLVELNPDGQDKTIAKDVDRVCSIDTKTGTIYYTREEENEVPYSDIIYDDANVMTANQRERLQQDTYSYTTYAVYCYKDGESMELTKNAVRIVNSYDGKYCLYLEYPSLSEMRIGWSKVLNSSTTQVIREEFEKEQALVVDIASEKSHVYQGTEYGSDGNIGDICYDGDREILYYVVEDADQDECIVNSVEMTGKNAGVINACSASYEDISLVSASKQGIYYLADFGKYGGDLYCNEKKIADEVLSAAVLGDDGSCICNGGYNKDGSYILQTVMNGKVQELQDDVAIASGAEDGTVVFLSDYDVDRSEGQLNYFDGKKIRTIDDDVCAFARRRDSKDL